LLFWTHFKAGFGPSGKHKTAYRNSFNIASYLWDTTLVQDLESASREYLLSH
jgi:hypothetical protein